jgi:catechol 2,3-dioxygenase-like lactoylglutathione lyase family enzyme
MQVVPKIEDAILHHVGIVVPEDKFEDFIDKFWHLGLDLGNPISKRIKEFKCDCLLYGQIEIVIPDKDSKLYGWLGESITPMHHIAFQVHNVNLKCEELASEGVPVLYHEAVEGVGGTLVNFIHPLYTGVMIELVEVQNGKA